MSGAQALERGYRRLLAWYPAWHRQAHGEEMIGVLLAAAPGSRRRPGLGETLNIIWAGLLIRLRPRATALASGAWPDALAVFSVVAPVALSCLAIAWDLARGTTSPANAGLAAVPLYVLLITSTAYLFSRPVALALLTYLPPLAAAGLALRAARRSRRPGPDGEPA